MVLLRHLYNYFIFCSFQVEEGFTMTSEEIVGRLNSALSPYHQHSNCNDTEETGN
jgi:hypothetical protein